MYFLPTVTSAHIGYARVVRPSRCQVATTLTAARASGWSLTGRNYRRPRMQPKRGDTGNMATCWQSPANHLTHSCASSSGLTMRWGHTSRQSLTERKQNRGDHDFVPA